MNILHISPSYFNSASVIGGGERYAYELAKAASKRHPTVFLSFAKEKTSAQTDTLKEVYVKTIADPDFFKCLDWADTIHCHQIAFHHTDWAILYGKLYKRKKVFATDLGGAQLHCLSGILPIRQCLDGLLFISNYSKKSWLQNHPRPFPGLSEIIYGGVDETRFFPDFKTKRNQKILYVGRIVSHKGIEHLIDALDNTMELEVVGRVYENEYFEFLLKKSSGKNVRFLHHIEDGELVQKYRTAAAVVQPSVYKNYTGNEIFFPELLGLAALEAMACAAPVMVTDAASLPELIQNGETGFIVPPNNPSAIREKLIWILSHPNEAYTIGKRASEAVFLKYTWAKTAERCDRYYSGEPSRENAS